jgi:hypothetical protein
MKEPIRGMKDPIRGMKDPIRGMKDKQNQIHHMKTKIDWKQYEKRVTELENEGLCTSDAQSVADVEFAALDRPEADPSGVTLAAHTPGPWTASGCTVYAGEIMLGCTYCEGNRELHPVICDSELLPDSTGIHGSGWDESGANARLIAAAPDLLEACLWLIARVPTNAPDGKSQIAGIEAARAAIAKAEGRNA